MGGLWALADQLLVLSATNRQPHHLLLHQPPQALKRWRLMVKALPPEYRGSFQASVMAAGRKIWGARLSDVGAQAQGQQQLQQEEQQQEPQEGQPPQPQQQPQCQ
jgi:hypothetical protein